MLLAGCGRFGFGSHESDGGPSGDDAVSAGDDAPDAMPGSDGTGGLPAGCLVHSPIICDDFERLPLTDFQGEFSGENDAAGMLSLSNTHFYGGTTSLQIHLDGDASARAVIYKDIQPPTQNIHVRYALRFDAVPDRTVFGPEIYLQDTTTDRAIHIFPNFTAPNSFSIEGELLGPAGLIRDAFSESMPLPTGRWIELDLSLDLSSGTPALTVSVDGIDAPSTTGPYFLDAFTPTNESVYIGSGFSEGGSPLDYWIDDVSVFSF